MCVGSRPPEHQARATHPGSAHNPTADSPARTAEQGPAPRDQAAADPVSDADNSTSSAPAHAANATASAAQPETQSSDPAATAGLQPQAAAGRAPRAAAASPRAEAPATGDGALHSPPPMPPPASSRRSRATAAAAPSEPGTTTPDDPTEHPVQTSESEFPCPSAPKVVAASQQPTTVDQRAGEQEGCKGRHAVEERRLPRSSHADGSTFRYTASQ